MKLAAQEAAAKSEAESIPPVQKAKKMLAWVQKFLAETESGTPYALDRTMSALKQAVAALTILADEVEALQNAPKAE